MPDAARPGELVATLTLLRERIAKLAARSRLSLAATKRELVEPLLAALGWQTGDPESVRAPYRPPGGSRRLDYALLVYAQPALAISVRPLLRALESEELAVQLAELAAAGVASLATSDGDRWSFYATQAEDELPAPLQELRLSTATTRAATKALARLRPEGLSRPLRRSPDEREELEPALARVLAELIAAPEPALLRLLAARLPQLPPEEVRSALARAELSLRFRPADDKERGAAPAGSAAALAAALAAAGLPAPLALEKRFRGVLLLASLEADGRIRFRGRRYASAAAAAEAARAAVGSTAAGELARSDGLRFWAYREPQSGVLRPLAELGNDSES